VNRHGWGLGAAKGWDGEQQDAWQDAGAHRLGVSIERKGREQRSGNRDQETDARGPRPGRFSRELSTDRERAWFR
jgi:hypothetical protein